MSDTDQAIADHQAELPAHDARPSSCVEASFAACGGITAKLGETRKGAADGKRAYNVDIVDPAGQSRQQK